MAQPDRENEQEGFGPLFIHAAHLRVQTQISPLEIAFAQLVRYALTVTKDLWPDKPTEDELIVAGLIASLFEYGETLWHLIRAKHSAACGTILRAQVEIVAIVAQLSTSKTPHRDECAAYLKELKSATTKYSSLTKQGNNIYALPLDDLILQIEKKYPGLQPKSRNFSEMTEAVSPRLLQIYKHLCLEAHNNLPAIGHRHFRNGRIVAFAPLPTAIADQYLRWSAYCHVEPVTRYLRIIGDQSRESELTKLYDDVIATDPT